MLIFISSMREDNQRGSNVSGVAADTSSPEAVARDYADGWSTKEKTKVETALCRSTFDAFNKDGDFDKNLKDIFAPSYGAGISAKAGAVTTVDATHARAEITLKFSGAPASAQANLSHLSGTFPVVKGSGGWKVCLTSNSGD